MVRFQTCGHNQSCRRSWSEVSLKQFLPDRPRTESGTFSIKSQTVNILDFRGKVLPIEPSLLIPALDYSLVLVQFLAFHVRFISSLPQRDALVVRPMLILHLRTARGSPSPPSLRSPCFSSPPLWCCWCGENWWAPASPPCLPYPGPSSRQDSVACFQNSLKPGCLWLLLLVQLLHQNKIEAPKPQAPGRRGKSEENKVDVIPGCSGKYDSLRQLQISFLSTVFRTFNSFSAWLDVVYHLAIDFCCHAISFFF